MKRSISRRRSTGADLTAQPLDSPSHRDPAGIDPIVQPGSPVLERLMRYHRLLAETRGRILCGAVTSAEVAAALDIDPTQVRKDFAAIGLRGRGRVGYDVADAITVIREVLGFDRTHWAVLVGAGHLGGALLAYRGFAKYGLKIAAAFDSDRARTGRTLAGCPVRNTRSMRPFILRHRIRLAILATPADVAQEITDRLVAAGIRAIWNFAPIRLAVPEGVRVRDEHISVGLSRLTHHLNERTGSESPDR